MAHRLWVTRPAHAKGGPIGPPSPIQNAPQRLCASRPSALSQAACGLALAAEQQDQEGDERREADALGGGVHWVRASALMVEVLVWSVVAVVVELLVMLCPLLVTASTV